MVIYAMKSSMLYLRVETGNNLYSNNKSDIHVAIEAYELMNVSWYIFYMNNKNKIKYKRHWS